MVNHRKVSMSGYDEEEEMHRRMNQDCSELDFEKVDFEDERVWSWNSGWDTESYRIWHIDEEGRTNVYNLPACINEIITGERHRARREVQEEIQAALGINPF